MYQPEFPPVPFRLGLYPVVDSVQWIERLLDAGVRTLQLRIKDQRDEEVEADVVAAIALGRRYNARLFINDYWRLAIKHQRMASIWGRKICKPPISAPSARQVCGWAFRPMTIWRSTSRWHHAPLISRWDMCSQRKPNRCLLHRRGWNSWHGMLSAWRIIPPWRLAVVSLARAPAVIATGVGSIAVVSAITQAADWRLATAQLLEIAGVGDE